MLALDRIPWRHLLILLALVPLSSAWAQDPADPESLRLERKLQELDRRQLELDEQIEALAQERLAVRIEADALRQELRRLHSEVRAATAEAKGAFDEADFVRRHAELNGAAAQIQRELTELESERRQAIQPLMAERRELSLRQRERSLEGVPDDGTLATRLSEIRDEIEDLDAGFRFRLADLERRRAEVIHRRYELFQQQEIQRGNEAAAQTYEERIAQAAERRAKIEIGAVFDELEHELRVQYRKARRDYYEAPVEARADLRPQFDAIRADLERLAMSRRSFREEIQLKELEHRLGEHLQALEKARQSAEPTEAKHLEDEIQGLRKAVSALVEATLENG